MHFAYGRDVNHRELKGRLAVGLQSGPQCSLTHILFICVCVCVCVHLVTQLRLTLYNLMDCSPPGSSVHGAAHTAGAGTSRLLPQQPGLQPALLLCQSEPVGAEDVGTHGQWCLPTLPELHQEGPVERGSPPDSQAVPKPTGSADLAITPKKSLATCLHGFLLP